jgi:hypothetical protein
LNWFLWNKPANPASLLVFADNICHSTFCTALFDELDALAVDGFEFEFSEVQPASPARIATSVNTTHAVSNFFLIHSASRT